MPQKLSCKRPWGRFTFQIFMQGPLITWHLQDLHARTSEDSTRIFTTSFIEGPSRELKRSLGQDLWESATLSTAPQRERSNTHKAPKGHRVTTRAFWHARSTAPAMRNQHRVPPNGSSVPKVPRLPAPAPVMQNHVPDLKISRKSDACHETWTQPKTWAPRACKTTPLEQSKTRQALCASLRSRNAHGHLTRAQAGADETINPDGAPWSKPGLTLLP